MDRFRQWLKSLLPKLDWAEVRFAALKAVFVIASVMLLFGMMIALMALLSPGWFIVTGLFAVALFLLTLIFYPTKY